MAKKPYSTSGTIAVIVFLIVVALYLIFNK